MSEIKFKAWAVTNLGGRKLIWGSVQDRQQRLPIFADKKKAEAERKRLDAEKPSPNRALFERRVVAVEVVYKTPTY